MGATEAPISKRWGSLAFWRPFVSVASAVQNFLFETCQISLADCKDFVNCETLLLGDFRGVYTYHQILPALKDFQFYEYRLPNKPGLLGVEGKNHKRDLLTTI